MRESRSSSSNAPATTLFPRRRHRPQRAARHSELLGALIETAGRPEQSDVYPIVSDILAAEPDTAREMLGLVQTMRDLGTLDESESCYLCYWIIDQLSFRWSTTDAELGRLSASMEAIERRHGLTKDEYFLLDEAPPEWRALSDEYERRLDALWGDEFARIGEAELARLVRTGALHDDPRILEGRASLIANSHPGDDDSSEWNLRI